MTKYLFQPEELTRGVSGAELGLDFLSCRRIELGAQQMRATIETDGEETLLVCIAGQAEFTYNDTRGALQFKDFLYVPWKSKVVLQTNHQAVIMQIGSPSDRATSFAHIPFSEVAQDPARHKVFGQAETASLRDVFMHVGDQFPAARLLAGICEARPGGWTGWPPHEHGNEKEELYIYFDMGNAFGIQCAFESLDKPLFLAMVRDGNAVPVRAGYHPSVGCPGGRMCYIYAMAARVPGERSFMALRVMDQFGKFG
jgi:5-deoxy-glucuronate isomerase